MGRQAGRQAGSQAGKWVGGHVFLSFSRPLFLQLSSLLHKGMGDAPSPAPPAAVPVAVSEAAADAASRGAEPAQSRPGGSGSSALSEGDQVG